jgi:DNA-binding XRE family transcriptional regulator
LALTFAKIFDCPTDEIFTLQIERKETQS